LGIGPGDDDEDDDDNDEDDASAMFRNVSPFNWLRVKFKKTLPNTQYGATHHPFHCSAPVSGDFDTLEVACLTKK